MNGPRLTICVPTYNRREDLRRLLGDLAAQTWEGAERDVEIVVGDDASSDGTGEMLRTWPDERVRPLLHPKNLGIYANWNAMVGAARGDLVAIYHDHDVYLPTVVERSVGLFDAHPGLAMVHTAVVMVDERLEPLQPDVRDLPEAMPGAEFRNRLADMMHSPVMAATTTVRREAYAAVGPYDDSRYGLGCDKDMWFRLASVGGVGYVREPQAFIRARTRADGTAKFRWGSAAGGWRMRLDELAALRLDDGKARREIASEYERLMARTALLGTDEEAREGEALATEFGLRIPAAYRAIRRVPGVRGLAERTLLARHYRGTAGAEARARAEGAEFMASHPELARLLRERRPPSEESQAARTA